MSIGNAFLEGDTRIKCSPVRTNHRTSTFSLKCHLSQLHAKLDHFVQPCVRKAPICYKALRSDGHRRCNCIATEDNPARMFVSSTGAFVTNEKEKLI